MYSVDAFFFANGLPYGHMVIFGTWFTDRYEEPYGVYETFTIVLIGLHI
jgi:hypothetical protein